MVSSMEQIAHLRGNTLKFQPQPPVLGSLIKNEALTQ